MREHSDARHGGGGDSSDESIHPPSCSTCPDDDDDDHRTGRRGRNMQGGTSARRKLPPFDRTDHDASSGEERERAREKRRAREAERSHSSSPSHSPARSSASHGRKYTHPSSSAGSESDRGAARHDRRQKEHNLRHATSPSMSDRRPGPLRETEPPPPWAREEGGGSAWGARGGGAMDSGRRGGSVAGRQGAYPRSAGHSESEGSSVGRGQRRPPTAVRQDGAGNVTRARPGGGGMLSGDERGRGHAAHAGSQDSDDASDNDRRLPPPPSRQLSGARIPRPASGARAARDSSRGSSVERGGAGGRLSRGVSRSRDGSGSDSSEEEGQGRARGGGSGSRPQESPARPSGVAGDAAGANNGRVGRAASYASSHDDDDDDDGDSGHRGRAARPARGGVVGGRTPVAGAGADAGRHVLSSSESESSRVARPEATPRTVAADSGGAPVSSAPHAPEAALSPGTPLPRAFNEKDEYFALQHAARHPDEALPMRIAYQHLDQLAVSAAKISAAVEADRRMLQRQVAKANMSQLRLAFRAWRLGMFGDKEKQEKLRRAVNKMARGRMLRTFEHWREVHGWANKHKQMQGQIKGVLRRKKALRLFKAWRAAVEASTVRRDDRWREKRNAEEMHARFSSWLSRRAAFLVYKRRVARVFAALDAGAEARREKRRKMERAVRKMLHRKLGVAFEGWRMAVEGVKRRRSRASRAILKMLNRRMAQAFAAWWEMHEGAGRHKHILRICLGKMNNRVLASGWAAWVDYVDTRLHNRAKLNNALRRMANRQLAAAFYGLQEIASWRRTSRSRLQRALRHMLNSRLARSWRAWVNFLVITRGEKGLTLQERVQLMEEQLERLREENERFRRVIDSGEWGQARIAEMVKAGEVLMGERDALARLLEQLRAEYVDAAERGSAQADEIRALKQRMLAGNFAQRNKLLVRGASSFNALVRALKADVLEAGADPEVLYSLDRLSLDRVDVFPDGELHVQAINASKLPWATPKSKDRSSTQDSAGSPAGVGAQGLRHSASAGGRRSFSSFADSPALVAGIKQRDRILARQASTPNNASTRLEDTGGQARGARERPGRSRSGGLASTTLQGGSQDTSQRIVEALSSLTPEEVTALQTELEKTAAGFAS
eukprot:jgi/Mesvir1/23429/Mv22289-RA.1